MCDCSVRRPAIVRQLESQPNFLGALIFDDSATGMCEMQNAPLMHVIHDFFFHEVTTPAFSDDDKLPNSAHGMFSSYYVIHLLASESV